jgi:putative endonuclease
MPWFLYLIECSDASIYTGIALDVEARYQQHLEGKGARYTRSHPPQRLLASFAVRNRSIASRLEYYVKRLSAAQKRALADGTLQLPDWDGDE